MEIFSNCSLFWLPTTNGTKKLFPKIIRLDTWNAVLIKQPTFFAQTPENTLLGDLFRNSVSWENAWTQ